mgnify:CR=1 FL=1
MRELVREAIGLDIRGGHDLVQAFENSVEHTLIQPTFVTHLPKELVPLAKLSPEDPTTVEVFECCINGQEIAPASWIVGVGGLTSAPEASWPMNVR